MRLGGLRLEKEMFDYADTGADGFSVKAKTIPVIHCYGAGAGGYKISWEVARRVEEMVRKTSTQSPKHADRLD
jgi:D-amino-acid oxidase